MCTPRAIDDEDSSDVYPSIRQMRYENNGGFSSPLFCSLPLILVWVMFGLHKIPG